MPIIGYSIIWPNCGRLSFKVIWVRYRDRGKGSWETIRFPASSPRHSRHKQPINGKKEHFPFAVLLMRVVSPKAITHSFLSCGGGWQASSAVSRPVGSRLAPSPTGVSPFPRHLIHILTNEPYVVRRYLPHFLHEKLNDSGHKLFSAVKMVVPHIDVSVSLTNARRAGKLRDSNGRIGHGEIPQGRA